MDIEIRYRGRTITRADLDLIRRLIQDNPSASRRALSAKLCEAWNWVQSNGAPRDMVARGLLLHLHREGHITLPAQKFRPPNNVARHSKPPCVPLLQWDPIPGPLSVIRPLEIRQVRRTGEESLFDSFIETYHYLGYTRPVGEHLKYLIFARGVPAACMGWSSAPRHIGCRDRFIGWRPETRRRNIHFLAYNTRYLILPWARLPHLASHILGQIARRISSDWIDLYEHPIWFLETFVDPERFRGTCYRAANWLYLGKTTGLGKDNHTNTPNRSIKEVLGYPLAVDFRDKLGVG
jgi:hypothetical protein